jgi:hypothetical protein
MGGSASVPNLSAGVPDPRDPGEALGQFGGKASSSSKSVGGKASDFFQKTSGLKGKKELEAELARRRGERAGERQEFVKGELGRFDELQSVFSDLASGATTVDQVSKDLGIAFDDVQNLRDIAQTEGPTAIAQRLTEQQQLEEVGLIEGIEEGQATQAASAFGGLAQSGGAGPGARERLAASSGAAGLREQQRTRRFGAEQRAGIGSEDEARKLQIAGKLPGLEAGLAGQVQQARQGDFSNQLAAQKAAGQVEGARGQFAQQTFAAEQLAAAQGDAARAEAQKSLFDLPTPSISGGLFKSGAKFAS